MSYNNKNFYRKVIDIQKIVLEKQDQGVKDYLIWQLHIYPLYRISYSTYKNYKGIPASRELKKILLKEESEREEREKAEQLDLFKSDDHEI